MYINTSHSCKAMMLLACCLICISAQVELKEFVKVGHDICKVPKPTDPEEESGKVVRRINNKPVRELINELRFKIIYTRALVTSCSVSSVVTCRSH